MEGFSSFPQRPGRSAFRAVLFLFGWISAIGCSQEPIAENRTENSSPQQIQATSSEDPIFLDVTEESGLDFHHFTGASGDLHFPEILGGGSALFDADRDGDLDLYLVQGALWPGQTLEDALLPPPGDHPLRDRLFLNHLELNDDGTRTFRWTDVTEESGLNARGYGTGVAVGDFNGDGWDDLYITAYGSNQLWAHQGVGDDGIPRFQEVTEITGTDDHRWSTSASWADFNRDGHLDLYIANYVDFRLSIVKTCRQPSGLPDYCGPLSYRPESDRLFLHPGQEGLPFLDVSGSAGILSEASNGLGVSTADFDDDGWIDIYVANDQTANFFWRNQKAESGALFFNDAAFAGAAVSADGKPEASMGIDSGDLDNDGDLDLFMTHLDGETNTFYANDGDGLFTDRSSASRLGGPSVPHTGFGTALLDFDNDGLLDVLTVNGAVKIDPEQAAAGSLFPFAQTNQLFRNLGVPESGGVPSFEEVPTPRAGAAFAALETSRGASIGDLDNDGDVDLVITNAAGPARVLRNELGHRQHWLGLTLLRGDPARIDLGAAVDVVLGDGRTLHRRVRRDGSFLSSHDPRLLLGLGAQTEIRTLHVRWSDGTSEIWESLQIDRYHTLTAGGGKAVP